MLNKLNDNYLPWFYYPFCIMLCDLFPVWGRIPLSNDFTKSIGRGDLCTVIANFLKCSSPIVDLRLPLGLKIFFHIVLYLYRLSWLFVLLCANLEKHTWVGLTQETDCYVFSISCSVNSNVCLAKIVSIDNNLMSNPYFWSHGLQMRRVQEDWWCRVKSCNCFYYDKTAFIESSFKLIKQSINCWKYKYCSLVDRASRDGDDDI